MTENVFKPYIKRHSVFDWESLGNIAEGRETLGEDMYVLIYRLMCGSLTQALKNNIGENQALHFVTEAGRLSGYEFAGHFMDLTLDFDAFIAQLQTLFRELKIGLLSMEKYDVVTGEIELAVMNDMGCSGMEDSNETVCQYEAGFLSGIMYAYTGEDHLFVEELCWARGDRMCSFHGRVMH